jgi:hypothetical protein
MGAPLNITLGYSHLIIVPISVSLKTTISGLQYEAETILLHTAANENAFATAHRWMELKDFPKVPLSPLPAHKSLISIASNQDRTGLSTVKAVSVARSGSAL